MRSKENVCSGSLIRRLLIIAIAGLLFPIFTTAFAGPAAGWVKLYDASSTRQKHNLYEVKGVTKQHFNGKLFARNVRCGDLATDPVIPDGYYYVTFWVMDASGTEVEHKENMEFKGGNTVNGLPLTVAGRITSAGVTYPR